MRLTVVIAIAAVGLTAGADAAKRNVDPFAGRIATKTSDCVATFGNEPLTILDQNTLLYRENGKRIWRNSLPDGCPGLDPDDILIVEPFGGQFCRGDRFRGVDRLSRIPSRFCRLGSFTAYEKPAAR